MDTARLADELRRRIDAVFLPRPLLLVAALPRTATGKLPQAALQAFAAGELDAQGRKLDTRVRTLEAQGRKP